MNRLLWFCLFCIFGIISISTSSKTAQNTPDTEASSHESKTTIEGLVRDIACPIQNYEATATKLSIKCLLACVRKGSPIVILTKDGDLYLPISNKMPDEEQRQRLMPFLGKYVRVNGIVYERKGTHAISIREIVELKDVHLDIVD